MLNILLVTFPFFALVLAGFVAARRGMLPLDAIPGLNGFVGGSGLATFESTARYPLLEAAVEVRDRRGAPGVYNCTVHLKPHHQLDEVGASFRLVTEFSQRNATV